MAARAARDAARGVAVRAVQKQVKSGLGEARCKGLGKFLYSFSRDLMQIMQKEELQRIIEAEEAPHW